MRIEKLGGVIYLMFNGKKDIKKYLLEQIEGLNCEELKYLLNEVFKEEMNNHDITTSAWWEGE